MNGNYSLCTIFRLEKEKYVCYHMYNKEEIKQQSKNNQIICDRNEMIKSKTPKAEKIKSLQTHKRK